CCALHQRHDGGDAGCRKPVSLNLAPDEHRLQFWVAWESASLENLEAAAGKRRHIPIRARESGSDRAPIQGEMRQPIYQQRKSKSRWQSQASKHAARSSQDNRMLMDPSMGLV